MGTTHFPKVTVEDNVLTAIDRNPFNGEISLTWYVPHDDGSSGTVRRFEDHTWGQGAHTAYWKQVYTVTAYLDRSQAGMYQVVCRIGFRQQLAGGQYEELGKALESANAWLRTNGYEFQVAKGEKDHHLASLEVTL
jgi:hypothetical protein